MKRKSRVLVSFVVIVTILLTILSFNFTSYAADSKEVTIRIFNPGVPKGTQQDAVNKVIMDKYEKLYGYRIKWDYSTSDYAAQVNTVNLKLAAGDIDAFLVGSWDNTTSILLNKKGLLKPLNGLLDTYGKDIKNYFAKYAKPGIFKPVTINGEIKAIPVPNQVFTWYALWLRKDLLDKVGLKQPTTFSEYEKALYAIHKKFPDIIPLGSEAMMAIMNEFLGECKPINEVDKAGNLVPSYYTSGNYYFYPTSPSYKKWLQTMQKWYKDGILNRQLFVWKSDKTLDVAKQGKLASVAWGGWNVNQFVGNKQGIKWVPLYNLKSSSGQPLGWGYGTQPKGIFGIAGNSKVAKEIIQYQNWLSISPENQTYGYWGAKGITYDINDKGKLIWIKDLPAGSYTSDLNFQVTLYPKQMVLLGESKADEDPWNFKYYPEQMDFKAHPRTSLIDQTFLYSYPTSISSKFNDYSTLIEQTIQKVIMGAPVSEVDKTLKKLNAKGFQTYLTEKNKQFKAFNKK